MAESIASLRRVSMTGSMTGNEYQKILFRTGIKASPGIEIQYNLFLYE